MGVGIIGTRWYLVMILCFGFGLNRLFGFASLVTFDLVEYCGFGFDFFPGVIVVFLWDISFWMCFGVGGLLLICFGLCCSL